MQGKKISDTTLLNFMLNHRVDCNVSDYDRGMFEARAGLDTVRANNPRSALRGLYALRVGRPS